MFETTTKKVEKKYYWENMKYRKRFISDGPKVRVIETVDVPKKSIHHSHHCISVNRVKVFYLG